MEYLFSGIYLPNVWDMILEDMDIQSINNLLMALPNSVFAGYFETHVINSKRFLNRKDLRDYRKPIVSSVERDDDDDEDTNHFLFEDSRRIVLPKAVIAFKTGDIMVAVQRMPRNDFRVTLLSLTTGEVEDDVVGPWIILYDESSSKIHYSLHHKLLIPNIEDARCVDIGPKPLFHVRHSPCDQEQFNVGNRLILSGRVDGRCDQRLCVSVADGILVKEWQHKIAQDTITKPIWTDEGPNTTKMSAFVSSQYHELQNQTVLKVISYQGATVARQCLQGEHNVVSAYIFNPLDCNEVEDIILMTRGRMAWSQGESLRVRKFGHVKPISEVSVNPSRVCLPKTLVQPFKGPLTSVNCDGGRNVFWSRAKLTGTDPINTKDLLPTTRNSVNMNNSICWYYAGFGDWTFCGFNRQNELTKICESFDLPTITCDLSECQDQEESNLDELEVLNFGDTFSSHLYQSSD